MRPTREMFIGENPVFEGFVVDEVTGDIVNPELGLTAFIKSENEGSDYYKGIFVDVETVHMCMAFKQAKNIKG